MLSLYTACEGNLEDSGKKDSKKTRLFEKLLFKLLNYITLCVLLLWLAKVRLNISLSLNKFHVKTLIFTG